MGRILSKRLQIFLKTNGDIKKVVKIPDEAEKPTGCVLIEYGSDRAIPRLDPTTLGDVPSPKDPLVFWHVGTIRKLCEDELGRELAQKYLSELQALHGVRKSGFFTVLQSQLETFQSNVCTPGGTKVHTPVTQPCFASRLDTAASQS